MFVIYWNIFVEAGTEAKAERVLRKFIRSVGRESSDTEYERYWKDKSLFRVTTTIPLGTNDVSMAIFETLLICRVIAAHWIISPPQHYREDRWEFHGGVDTKTAISIAGISSIDFKLANFNQGLVSNGSGDAEAQESY